MTIRQMKGVPVVRPRDSYRSGIATILIPDPVRGGTTMFTPLFVGVPGGIELLAVLAIAILLFGPSKLPGLARSSGQAIGEFKKGRDEFERDLRATAEGQPESDDEANEVEQA